MPSVCRTYSPGASRFTSRRPPNSSEHHRSGGLRILATARRRSAWPLLPEVPTLKESGVDIEAPGWFAFYAVSGTPKPMTDRLEREIATAAGDPAVRARIEALGLQATDPSSQNLMRVQRAEFVDAWAGVIKATGFKPE